MSTPTNIHNTGTTVPERVSVRHARIFMFRSKFRWPGVTIGYSDNLVRYHSVFKSERTCRSTLRDPNNVICHPSVSPLLPQRRALLRRRIIATRVTTTRGARRRRRRNRSRGACTYDVNAFQKKEKQAEHGVISRRRFQRYPKLSRTSYVLRTSQQQVSEVEEEEGCDGRLDDGGRSDVRSPQRMPQIGRSQGKAILRGRKIPSIEKAWLSSN